MKNITMSWEIYQNEHGLSSIGRFTKHFCEEIQKLKKPPM